MGQGQKFNTLERLSNTFDAVSAKGNSFSDIVKAANNFLLLHFVSSESSPEEQRIAEANIGFSDAISTSVIPTVNTPNEDERSLQKKKEEESARDEILAALQRQIQEANERISKMIDECQKMAEWCRKEAKKIDETIGKITAEMMKEGQFLHDADEMIDGYRTTGKLDREKARRTLLERGIKTKDDVSNARLVELLEKEKLKSSQNYNDLNDLKDRSEKLKEDVLAKEKAFEETARRAQEQLKTIEGDKTLAPQEQLRRTEEAEKNAAEQFRKTNEEREATQRSLEKIQKEAEKSVKNSESKATRDDFLGALDGEEAERGSLGKKFVSAANPATEKPNADNKNPENKDDIELAKLGKVSGPSRAILD
ncbi:MAG TPA: hypothetical protein PKX38_03335 [Alphaproteobacteria bacterium]|nr:hypothetical protein [Alphaproteobacteria bacterium]